MLQGAESFVTEQTSPLHQHSLLKHDTMSQLTTQFVAGNIYFILRKCVCFQFNKNRYQRASESLNFSISKR